MTSATADLAVDSRVPGLRAGLLGWVFASVALVLLRGVRWDENYEFAQVVAGQVAYPDGHPLPWWVRNLVSVQLYASALMLEAGAGAFLICLTRNILFVWATVLPSYLMGAALAQRALAGHVAAALVLAGVHTTFDGSYPQFTLPGMFSNGHIGTGFALCAVAALALGRIALGFFLIGLMPAVHIGQAPPLFLLLGLVLVSRRLHPAPGVWRRADLALVAGTAISAGVWLVGRFALGGASPPDAGASPDEIRAIWGGWVTYHDMHRRPPGMNSILLTVGFALLAYAVLFGQRVGNSPNARQWIVCIVYGAVALLIVLAVMLVQTLLGADVPYALLTWLPYRLWNHIPPIVIAMLCAILLKPRDESGVARDLAAYATVALMLALATVRPLFLEALPESISYRYFGTLDPVVFFLFGAAYTLMLSEIRVQSERRFATFALAGAVVLMLTAFVHQYGTIAALAGALTTVAIGRIRPIPRAGAWVRNAVIAAVAILLLSLTWQEWRARQTLWVSSFERAMAAHLASKDDADAMLLGPMGQVLLQAQTGHPVVADLATPFFIAYRPSFGPRINTMFRDIYGVDFRYPVPPREWQQIWTERSQEEWQSLAERYGFSYVISPEDAPLRLPVEFNYLGRRLYRATAP